MTWDPRALPDLSGRTYLVTGSNAGLGYFASEQLVRAGASVIMSARHPNRLSAARAAIRRRVPEAAADATEPLILDTANLGSVRSAAASIRGRGALDGVLLNAGIVHPPRTRQTTVDGNELVLATNALGHFALAVALLPALARTHGRMVWVGSRSVSLTPYDPVDPQLAERYSAWRAYVQSKVATAALGFEADRRLRAANVPVQSVVAQPGYAIGGRTPGIAGVNEPSRAKRFRDNLQAFVAQSKEQGAWALVQALADPAIAGGEFWGPRFTRGVPHRQKASKIARDPAVGARLWDAAEAATGVRWPHVR